MENKKEETSRTTLRAGVVSKAISRRAAGPLCVAGAAAGSLSLPQPLWQQEGWRILDLCVRCVLNRVRIVGVAVEAVVSAAHLKKFLWASFTVKQGSSLLLGASRGGSSLYLVEVTGYHVWRSYIIGWFGPRMGGGGVEMKILLPRWYHFLLSFFLFLCAAAGGMSCFARAVSLATVPEPDPNSLPSERGYI